MKVFELGYPFLVEGEEKLRWDSDGPVTQSMIAGILWVWAPKYRKWILRGDLRAYVGKLFHRIAEDLGFDIQEMEGGRRSCAYFLVVSSPVFDFQGSGHFEEYFEQPGLPRTSQR